MRELIATKPPEWRALDDLIRIDLPFWLARHPWLRAEADAFLSSARIETPTDLYHIAQRIHNTRARVTSILDDPPLTPAILSLRQRSFTLLEERDYATQRRQAYEAARAAGDTKAWSELCEAIQGAALLSLMPRAE